ncbi:hypothetical protein SCARR_02058 [Pontiella sulfatireligans]|uniref:Uncharacterized protein n=1 Tax=Pontiella sulfatireligans TaxID=2750658 RepID=A0A6C2UH25_9BACT|nr:hypothetical protein SCARR_01210 [Pontiella sulfatireligans]VGO19998.1 hypothetical protein SCARR_02058 [Pontiella sulfatireligans]
MMALRTKRCGVMLRKRGLCRGGRDNHEIYRIHETGRTGFVGHEKAHTQ